MALTDFMCQEKKEEENLPALKTASKHPYNDSKTTYKSVKEDCLQPPETIQKNDNSQKAKMKRKTT